MINRYIAIFVLSLSFVSANSQCLPFIFKENKWSISAEGSGGTLLFSDLGKGYEFTYGLSSDWAPFKKVFYFTGGVRQVHQLIYDKSPDPQIFIDLPDVIKMHSVYWRMQFGIKLRFEWLFKEIEYYGIHPYIGVSVMFDNLTRSNIDLKYENSTITETDKFVDEVVTGRIYEFGISWVINDQLKWETSGFVNDQRKYSSFFSSTFNSGFSSKLSLGINTGIYFMF